MSALGAVPGYAFPAFDYGSAEFAEIVTPVQVVTVAGSPNFPIAVAGDGSALYIREVHIAFTNSAVVASRNFALVLTDSDGGFPASYTAPNTGTASSSGNCQWSIGLSTTFITGNQGAAPMPAIVIPPGWFWTIYYLNAQVGDQLGPVTATGLRIPNTPPSEAPILLPTQPMFT